jgi:signal transduction histidine kinase
MRIHLNIKSKLTLWYLLFLFIVLLFFSGLSYLILNQNIYHTNKNTLSTVSFVVENPAGTSTIKSETVQPGLPGQSFQFLVAYSIDANQIKRIQSETLASIPVDIGHQTISLNQKSFITPEMTGNQEVWLYYRPDVNSVYYEILAITQPKAEALSLMGVYKNLLFIAIPATLALAGVLGFFLVKMMLKPVASITSVALDIQENDLKRRIVIQNNDELGRLSATLNQAFEHLQQSIERERQFTNDASHELQTPLAIIQGKASLALTQDRSTEEYQKTLEAISLEITRMHYVVSKLLKLARADNGEERLNKTELNLKTILSDIADDIQLLCENKQLTFRSELGDAKINADEVKIRELFLNLLDNAIKYTPTGGTISLILSRKNKAAVVDVTDTGVGISPVHLPHIFERFFRVNKTHPAGDNGSGLGLAICKQIVELHRGQIGVRSKMGEGSTFTVILPLTNSNS